MNKIIEFKNIVKNYQTKNEKLKEVSYDKWWYKKCI